MPMTKKDTLRRMHQLQIEFPDEHMQKYWKDSNWEFNKKEAKERVEGMMLSYASKPGWHYTTKGVVYEHEGTRPQFPIEKHWVYVGK